MELDRQLKLLVEKYIRSGKKAENAPESTSEKEETAKMPNDVQEDVRTEEGAANKRKPVDRQP